MNKSLIKFLLHPILHQNNFSLQPGTYFRRIISLVPSQTEMLHYFGLDERLIGITKFCVHPAHWHQTKDRIGGTKNVNIEKVKALQPDLIIANKEENVKEQIEALATICPVYVSDVNDLATAMEMILQVGLLVNAKMQSETLVEQIALEFDLLQKETPSYYPTLSVAYLIWRKPYMAAGGDTFTHDMLSRCGLQNVFAHLNRYPEVMIENLQNNKPNLLFLSSEPFPFTQKHVEELQQQLPSTKIILVDGEMFSWYGSRLLQAVPYFRKLILQF